MRGGSHLGMLAEPTEGLLKRVAGGEGSFGTDRVRYLGSVSPSTLLTLPGSLSQPQDLIHILCLPVSPL